MKLAKGTQSLFDKLCKAGVETVRVTRDYDFKSRNMTEGRHLTMRCKVREPIKAIEIGQLLERQIKQRSAKVVSIVSGGDHTTIIVRRDEKTWVDEIPEGVSWMKRV